MLRRWNAHRASRNFAARVIDQSFPAALASGDVCGVRVELENTGAGAWTQADGIQLHVALDGVLLCAVPIPRPVVRTGERVTFHFALPAPSGAGSRAISAALFFPSVPHVAPLTALTAVLHVSPAADSDASRAFATMTRHNSWHYLPTCGIRQSRGGHPYPQFITRAKGAHVWDEHGNEFVDFTMGWGATILGHADDRVQSAIAAAVTSAPLTPFPDPIEMDVTRMLLEDFGGEFVLFGKNGSDVCTIAARLARLATGRTRILSCGFHGWQDAALACPQFRFNDLASFTALFEQHRHDLAAIMIEPAGPHDDLRGLQGDPDPSFLRRVGEVAREAGALLIYDEIMTGYRYPGGSVQKAFGEQPDLTCLGKAVASGMPLSALVGRTRRFHDLVARTHYCPTFKAEVYSLAAAKAAIGIYRREPIAGQIADIGERIKAAIDRACADAGLDAACRGPAFRFQLTFNDADPYVRRLKRTLYFQRLLESRIITVTGVMLPSVAHTPAIVDRSLMAVGSIVREIADADRARTLERAVEIPLL